MSEIKKKYEIHTQTILPLAELTGTFFLQLSLMFIFFFFFISQKKRRKFLRLMMHGINCVVCKSSTACGRCNSFLHQPRYVALMIVSQSENGDPTGVYSYKRKKKAKQSKCEATLSRVANRFFHHIKSSISSLLLLS